MNHLSDDQLYTMAIKVSAEADLTAEEEAALKHAAECDDCYHLLCCMMTMQHVGRNIGGFAPAAAQVPVRETITAVLKLAVDKVNSVLEQVETAGNAWTFRKAPMLLAGARSAGGQASAARKLTDTGSARTFVAYDAAKKLLMIQVDSAACGEAPRAYLRMPDGRQREIPFEKREDLFWAQVHGLEEGSYEIILEK